MIVSGGEDGTLRVWDASEGTQLRQVDQPGKAAVLAVALSPDGTVVAVGAADGVVRLWNVADGAAIGELEGHEGPIRAVAAVIPDQPATDRIQAASSSSSTSSTCGTTSRPS